MALQMDTNFVTAGDINQYRHIPIPEEMSFKQRMDSMGTIQKERRPATARNGSSFTTTSQVEFIINMNQPAKFANWRDAYIDLKITNGATNDIYFEGRVGILSLIDNLLVETDSSTRFSYITDAAELMAIELNKNVDDRYLDMSGKRLIGTSSAVNDFMSLANGEYACKALPCGLLPSGVMKQKYWPMFGSENLRIVIDLNSAVKAVIGEVTDPVAAQSATSLTISDIKLWYDVYTLLPDQYNALNAELGGVYKLYATDWTHFTDTLEANSGGKTVNLGLAKKKCKRVIAMIRAQADTSAYSVASVTNRDQAGVTQFYMTVDDQIVGLKEIDYKTSTYNSDDGAVAYAELMKANGGLLNVHTRNMSNSYSLVQPVGTLASTEIGSFFMEIGLDNGFGSRNALCGLPCKSNAYFTVVKSGINETELLDIYVEHISQYELNMNTGVWSVYG